MYVQLACARPREGACPDAPGMEAKQPFAAVLDDDLKIPLASGDKGLVELIAVTCRDERQNSRKSSPTGSRPRVIAIGRPIPNWSTSRCWNCSPTSAGTLQDLHRIGWRIEFMRPWTELIGGCRRSRLSARP